MQLFFYNLCSKAGMANYSVIPASSDTCELAPQGTVYGIGEVERVNADDCCAACLDKPWCLSWSQPLPGVCSLKDNIQQQPQPPPPQPPTPIDFKGKPGNCGETIWRPKSDCSVTGSGALRARENGITTLEECKKFCQICANCNYISFSIGKHGNEHDHDDCSWYAKCDMDRLTHTAANYTSAQVKNHSHTIIKSGRRTFSPEQRLPSPRYANCIVDGQQTVTESANSAQVPPGVDAEWFAVLKEHSLATQCAVASTEGKWPYSSFWTVMSQNGNAPANLGTDAACLPECYHLADDDRPSGWPPAVNASFSKMCPAQRGDNNNHISGLGFNNQPMNQAKVMVGYTDPSDPSLHGKFNWTFELDANLDVPEENFPHDKSLGVWEWWVDDEGKGVVRVYQRVSARYAWICTYFGADAGMGVKANQAYDGRGMMTSIPTTPDFLVRFFLNITGGGGCVCVCVCVCV